MAGWMTMMAGYSRIGGASAWQASTKRAKDAGKNCGYASFLPFLLLLLLLLLLLRRLPFLLLLS